MLDRVAVVVDPLVADADGERQPVAITADEIGDARHLRVRLRIPDAEQHRAVSEVRRLLGDAGRECHVEAVQDQPVERWAQGGQIRLQFVGGYAPAGESTRIVPAGIEGDEGRPLALQIGETAKRFCWNLHARLRPSR